MFWKSKHLQTSQYSRHSSHMLLHQTYIQAKRKDKETLTTTKCTLGHLQCSKAPKAPIPQDPLFNLKTIKSLDTSFAGWAQYLLFLMPLP